MIYEAHTRGLTRLWATLPEALRGSYEALAAEPVLEHLTSLGITALELLPVHAFIDDRRLLDEGLVNYWGYNSIGFFAPEPRYFGPAGAGGFRETVRKLHAAGIEVILDVVYNHTAEGDRNGPTLSFRGLDNAAYYCLVQGNERCNCNHTGCGNTLDVSHPWVLRLVLDSLRWWVEAMGVDGFRFDLAHHARAGSPRLRPLRRLLRRPAPGPGAGPGEADRGAWDLGPEGYRLGEFPPGFAEWNDGFRDGVRRFWRGEAQGAQELAERLLGSAGTFDRDGRRSWSSVNFVACHDGFTLADVTTYDEKRKRSQRRGQPGRPPGELERQLRRGRRERRPGDSSAPDPAAPQPAGQRPPRAGYADAARRRRDRRQPARQQQCLLPGQRNRLDRLGGGRHGLLGFTRRLTELRRAHPCLRQSRFLHGRNCGEDGAPDVEWLAFEGGAVDWGDPDLAGFCLLLRESAGAPAQATDSSRRDCGDRGDRMALIFKPLAPGGLHAAARACRRPCLAAYPGHRPAGGAPDRLHRPSTTRSARVGCRLCSRSPAVSAVVNGDAGLRGLAEAMGLHPCGCVPAGLEHAGGFAFDVGAMR